MKILTLLTLTLLLVLSVSGCFTLETKTNARLPEISIPEPVPLPTNPTNIQLFLRVVERLTNIAQTVEAREYVSIFTTNSTFQVTFSPEDTLWFVGISHGAGAWDAISGVQWFEIADQDYFFDSHWGEPKASWVIQQDGRITPVGKGILVEADVQQLNISRKLK